MSNSPVAFTKLQAEFYSGNKEKDDFALAVEPMELLSAAPLSINILGHLCLVATGKDFPLVDKTSDFKFSRLKTPESFRASLCQISNEGYWAFLEADTQMDCIRMQTETVYLLMNGIQNLSQRFSDS